jgi:hypothetical protein|tara:strand:- start:1 stop:3468 length:3468 start_codon:yes stop_codon:yes gene_type:complete
MARFRVVIAPGVAHIIDAANEDEARKKTRAEIAKGAVSPFYDELFFDYETGVDPKDPLLAEEARGIRQKLGRAETESEENRILNQILSKVQNSETPIEQEDIMDNEVGPAGYVRNTKGQLALTPYGLELLGLPVQQRTLQDGSTINLNTIIDENSFNLKTGDLADFSGITGPIVGTIAAFLPQTKILKAFTALFGGRKPLGNTFTAGVAGAAGKGAEEYLDTLEGFQLQDRDEIEDLLKEEFVIGSVGQGVFGEAPAAIYRMFLGKRAPIDNQRIVYQMSRNRSWSDVAKLDEDLGRIATEKEIKKAIKDGKVKKFEYSYNKISGAIPSQETLGRLLPGRLQQFSESVIGNNRDKVNIKALQQELNYLLRGIKKEKEALTSYISESSKKGLDESINKSYQTLRQREQDVTETLQQLLKDIGADVIEAGNYGNIPSRFEFGLAVKNTLSDARRAVTRESGNRYREVDKKFLNLVSQEEITIDKFGNPVVGQLKDELGRSKARISNIAINNIILKHLDVGDNLIKQYKDSSNLWKLQQSGVETPASVVVQLEAVLKEMRKRAQDAIDNNGVGGVNLRQIRNDISKIREITTETIEASQERKLLTDVLSTLDDTKIVNGKTLGNGDSILSEIEKDGGKAIAQALENSGFRILPADQLEIKKAVDDLRDANKLHYERMLPFETIEMDRLISNAKKGSINADRVYKDAILNGSAQDLKNIFRALAEYDDYIKVDKKRRRTLPNGEIDLHHFENKLKAQLKQRLFNDAFQRATNDGLTDINFTEFAREMKRYDRENLGKFEELFRNPATKISTGKDVLNTITQLNLISPRLKPLAVKNLVNNFTKKNAGEGLDASEQGRAFIRGLTELAEASDARLKFEANRAIARLPDVGIEETVNTIFRPGAFANINAVKETVSPEVFNSIQQASMQRLLSKSIDFNGKGKITDIFKHQNLKNSLDSYGDETLEAMFGREITKDLRQFQRQVDALTVGEKGRSGGAGGLVAAGLAATIVFNPLSTLPVLTSLAIARGLFNNRAFVSLMSKTDPGSIAQAIRIFNTTARQFGLRFVDGELVPFATETTDFFNRGIDAGATAIGISNEDIDVGVEESTGIIDNIRQRIIDVTKPINIPPPLPQVDTTQASVDPLSPERIDFAERIAGRPVV